MKKKLPESPRIIVICGPTGIGKTTSAIKLASIFSGEIISADSMQIYKYMNIGTAKPAIEEQKAIKHHLIDILKPNQNFSAALFSKKAEKIIGELWQNKTPSFITGGTGLYIKTLIYGIFKDKKPSEATKEQIKKEAAEKGTASLYEKLKKIDPEAAVKIDPNDAYRIIRALTVFETTGKKISSHHKTHQFAEKKFEAYKIGLEIDRQTLYKKINRRVDQMIEQGFIQETKQLLKQGYSKNLKSMQSIGYKHIISFLEGELPLDKAIDTMKRDTRRYAKRQITWFKADKEIVWTSPDNILKTVPNISAFLYNGK
ncbi:MAG: tRNA (adenosine(37)-N6)-dimethylallyltransferase MiaA [Deltaproteobacteria bacterium]|nr:tRNA (adenosine(37)-N6)-dimethylallyltransferase MiaA [Deltaproteobacteria bacterium]